MWFLNPGRGLGLGTVASSSEEPGWACPVICSDITSSRMFFLGTQSTVPIAHGLLEASGAGTECFSCGWVPGTHKMTHSRLLESVSSRMNKWKMHHPSQAQGLSQAGPPVSQALCGGPGSSSAVITHQPTGSQQPENGVTRSLGRQAMATLSPIWLLAFKSFPWARCTCSCRLPLPGFSRCPVSCLGT